MPPKPTEKSFEEQVAPRWMIHLLKLAGIYNLCWGTWVVLFPIASLKACGYPAPATYPELWQCIGMIVGVYGIGYWIAASAPFQHWPIVLVGLLGKVLGPIGFLYAWSQDRLPFSAGVLNIFNDLIWLPPFGVILWGALRHAQTYASERTAEITFAEAIQRLRSQDGKTIAELSQKQPLLVIFLRHSGCTFCRETLQQIQQQRHEIENNGTAIAFVHMSTEEDGKGLFERYGVADLPRFSDPEQKLYRAAEVGLGRFSQLLSWRVLWRGFQTAIVQRHGFSRVNSNLFRLPGTILVEQGMILKRHQPRDASDHPDYCLFPQ